MRPEDLYQATKINNHIKEYVRNNLPFPETLCFMEDDVIQVINNVSSGRERAYLMSLSAELSNLNNRVIDLLGIVIEMQVIAAYVKDDILDNNYKRNNQPTVNWKYNSKVATIYSDLFLNASYLALDDIRKLTTEIQYEDLVLKINESYQYICLGQIETACFNYSNSNLFSSIYSLYERLVGIAYGNYCSMLISHDDILKEQLFLFGKNIGIALQVKNDISDFIIDPLASGIPAYQDLLQNQPNIVMAYLLKCRDDFSQNELKLLNELLSHDYKINELGEMDETLILNMLDKSNAISKSIDLLYNLLSDSISHLSFIKEVKIRKRYTEFLETLIYE